MELLLVTLLAPVALVGAWGTAAATLVAWGRRDVRGEWDAIVVAGARVHADGRASPALHRRVRRAVELHERGVAPRLVFTGGGAPSEAEVAARIAHDLGVKPDAIVLEDRSRTTHENATHSAALVAGRVVVVTDDFHLFRTWLVFRPHFDAVAAAGARGSPRTFRYALREVPSIMAYAARGKFRSP